MINTYKMKSIENDTRMISEAWTDKVLEGVGGRHGGRQKIPGLGQQQAAAPQKGSILGRAGQQLGQRVQDFTQSKTGKMLGAVGKQVANAATMGTTGAAEDAAKIAAGTDTDSQINALNQKDQGHDQTDQSQEQRIAQLEQIIQQLQAQVQQLTGGQAQPAPASAPVNTTPQAPASPNAPIPGQ